MYSISTQWSKLHRRLRPQLATTVFPAHITSPGQKLRMLYNLSRTQPAGGILAAPAGGSGRFPSEKSTEKGSNTYLPASLGAPGAAPAALLLAAAPASIPAGLAAVHPAAPVPAVTTAAAAPSVAPVAAVARRAAPDRTPADGAEMHTAAQQYSNISQNQRDTLLNHHLSHLAAIVVSQTEATAEDLWDAVRDRLAELIEELNM